MRLRGRGKAEMKLLQALMLVVVLSSGCGGASALSRDELLSTDVRVPVHHISPNSSSDYKKLDTTYYYSDDSSEALLITYFIAKNSEGQAVRVARMSTCRHCGQLVNIDETRGQAPAPIIWASGDTGACRAYPPTYRSDPFVGDAFQSCLYWLDEDLNQYKLYTVWSEEEAVDFANSLIVLEQ
jgi:hypothetical protein